MVSVKEPEYKKVGKSLKYLIGDGAFWSLMDGFTTNFITPFALFLKASNLLIALLASLPDLVASLFQLIVIKINETFRSRKKILVAGIFLQACLWIPILFIPRLFPEKSRALALIIIYCLVVMMGYFTGPLWRGLVGELVPEEQRGSYFSKRNKVIAIVSLISGILAGWILQAHAATNPLVGFTILFATAFAARIISGIFLSVVYERQLYNPNIHQYSSYRYTLGRFLKDLTKSDYGKFVLFICLFRLAVSFASPFFSVYELKYLGYTYLQYTMLAATEIVSSFIFLGIWGRLNDERGSKPVILICGLVIPSIPLLYMVSGNFSFLLVVSVLSGAVWAGFNLGVGNFMFDAASPQERVRYASYFQLFHGISIFLGAITGGLLLNILPDAKSSIMTIFLISGIGRLIIALFLFPLLREMRLVELPFGKSFFRYPLIIKPRQSFVQDPFDYYLAYPKKPKRPRPRLYLDGSEEDATPGRYEKEKEQLSNKKFVDKMLGKDELFNRFFKKK
jgi:MFS family permease